MHIMQAFAARRADIAESLLQRERQHTLELQAQVAELQLLLEEQVDGFLMLCCTPCMVVQAFWQMHATVLSGYL